MHASLAVTTLSLLAAGFLQAQSLPTIPPDSPEWADTYNPPYKIPTELPAGSELRSELFGLLRSNVSTQHRFTGSLKVFRNWAFFLGRAVDPDGKSLRHPPHDNDDAIALWLRTNQGWKLVDFSFGHSDAFYIVWPEKYGAPAELLGIKQAP